MQRLFLCNSFNIKTTEIKIENDRKNVSRHILISFSEPWLFIIFIVERCPFWKNPFSGSLAGNISLISRFQRISKEQLLDCEYVAFLNIIGV